MQLTYKTERRAAILSTMSNKSGNIVKHTAAELRRMEKRGEVKTDWDAAAKKSLPSGGDPDDAMEEVDELTTEMPKRR